MRFQAKDLTTAGVLLALGIILPMVIHMSGTNGGCVFAYAYTCFSGRSNIR